MCQAEDNRTVERALSRLTRSITVRLTLSSLFQTVQERLGISVVPSHFYFPVPEIKSFCGKDWSACRPCVGIDFRLENQVRRLSTEILPFASEWSMLAEQANCAAHKFHFNNGFFEHVDAEVAYSFVRSRKPRRIVEVGCGHSTLLMAAAMRRNAAEGAEGEYIGVEPHPAPFLKGGVPGLTRMLEVRVQEAPLEIFRALRAGDILFIDSSHVVSIGSDVLHECLRILPELAPGVLVHFHDIFSPLDYPEKFVKTNLCFWGEQYLLEAFLAFNSAFQVVWAGSAMQQFHPEVLQDAFPAWRGSFSRIPAELKLFSPSLDGENVWPCSLWMERQIAG